jgi:hypothetical protein
MYRLNLDNRIFNNLRMDISSAIEDESGLCGLRQFKKAFFTFFKGETESY